VVSATSVVLLQVFGSFVVCKDRSVLEAVRQSGAPVDGITLDGDVMRRKGTISGGFVNANRSKILTHKRVRQLASQSHPSVTLQFALQHKACRFITLDIVTRNM
jgi:chromosome segregation ATPase